jgi:hypothetical protein
MKKELTLEEATAQAQKDKEGCQCVCGLMLAVFLLKFLVIVIGSLASCGSWFMCRSTQHHIVFECPIDPQRLAKQALEMCE